jgi:hypothetical protein
VYCLALLKSEDINIIGREYLFISNFSFCRERITFLILKPAYNGVAFFMFFCKFGIWNLCIHSSTR